MLDAFLQHHIDRLLFETKPNALNDCHVRGLDSIMLHDEPQNRIRLFFARPGHELHYNNMTGPRAFMPAQTLALHTHHCDVRLVPLFGPVFNYTVTLREHPAGLFRECAYYSAINDLGGGLEPTGRRFEVETMNVTRLGGTQRGLWLDASEVHGIFVPRHVSAAWLVMEGEEDAGYNNLCYTQNPTFNTEGMYSPMRADAVAETLRFVRKRVCE